MGYRGKLEEQNRARDLRAQGWTYAEIQAELGVARSSVSLWVRDVEVDPATLDARRRARWVAGNHPANRRPSRLHLEKLEEIEDCDRQAIGMLRSLSSRDRLVAGIALYAGEGSKADGSVRFANSDPRMIAFFIAWLREFFDVDETRLRVKLYLHEGLDLVAAMTFWSELTGIPTSQFNRPYRAVPDPSIRKAKHPMGCPSIVYGSARTHRLVMGLVRALLSGSQIDPG